MRSRFLSGSVILSNRFPCVGDVAPSSGRSDASLISSASLGGTWPGFFIAAAIMGSTGNLKAGLGSTSSSRSIFNACELGRVSATAGSSSAKGYGVSLSQIY